MPKTPARSSLQSFRLGSPPTLIRMSSLLFGALAIGHLSGHPWSSARTPQETQLVAAMKAISFGFMGEDSSYWNLYYGWGLLVALLLIALAAILWILSDVARVAPRQMAMVAGVLSVVSAVGAYLSFRYFYLPPAVNFGAISVLLLAVTLELLRKPTSSPVDEATEI